ncbi:16S rRNA (adenine(1518)-N(6)/adenine(1519)-N(6))-dimethyltransferase RsmA [Roseateles terrae]|uniref:Ribosomal RNA small subunit methyltransferase A n=1 Tax=Roseateles terrae TaxID=431060 RepID=A0ABR6GY35_9BURK|nr:16S rRNA (adenine(1518)-N(6)/adenine(1519)-N(6))-dimethyltransferase RsmA [Roseateles terrae]MBB3196033.1 16S rRNA (adenine1518-N6/adenine1519-N6)-dimethyltransferase [Roseateles terrae]OWQ85491.1 16S rRNA (adenine(1518)-N(6)/adenine(1519)-N(6))-dimethyltransferase [Roseateles terrae]
MGHIARKRFGQHFLTDRAVIDAIIDAIAPGEDQSMIEIGPGLGAMTLPLLKRLPPSSQPLTVVELDRDLAAKLRKRGDLTVIESDVLKVDFGALAQERGGKIRVVGNLPYNISSPILFHLLQFVDQVVDQTFMLQKEVVDRMAAGPGGKEYGRLSVMLQWRYDVEALFDVPPEAFDPPPRVDSAIVRMTPWATPALLDEKLFSEMVASAFSQRRKLLRHSLGRWLEARGYGGEFDLHRRAEEVPVAEFVALAQSL